ncbi:hypothetical protein [Psychroflexus planctonicus]|uniref:Lipocalin-like domain-containing protein n=1 Tax=Psychroflexus planctonicus TaxID=1526575 RepID=A0ABQ1SIK4_9FLAO|nr:hypothetical protein [Psychroflexus planctonicus]GGE37868.1 hypothetical protein GCM10010832_17680 [Psychroflexus planctonicus]
MKKFINLSILFVLALFLNACSSDDDGGSASPDTVEGSWEIYEVNYNGTFQFGEFEETINETYSTDICDPTPVASFSADGSLTLTDFEVEQDFFNEDETVCYVDGELTGTWEHVSGNTFILDMDDDEAMEVEITMSNGNNRINVKIDESEEEGDFEVTFKGNRM